MSESLVLFRDERNSVGLTSRACPHRGVDLSYGRCDTGGLRCLYHGWLFDVNGRCLEQPGEPAPSTFKDRVRLRAYPCREVGGLIFAYLGNGEPPAFPQLDFFCVPDKQRYVTKLHQACNYLQGLEGNFDQVHLSFLHRVPPSDARKLAITLTESTKSHTDLIAEDVSPSIELETTAFGFREYVRRTAPEGEYLKVEAFVYPNLAVFPGGQAGRGGYSGHWHVPIDDVSHWKFPIAYREAGVIEVDRILRGWFGDSTLGPDFRLNRSAENRYLQDRDAMREHALVSGLGSGFQAHDTWAVESPGPIQDRSQEHLGYSDKSVILMRKLMLDALRAIADGGAPPQLAVEQSDIMSIGDVVPAGTDGQRHLAKKIEEKRAQRSRLAGV
jgi:nitrite reductase/ring-hydroxylating ferredoxin subunit